MDTAMQTNNFAYTSYKHQCDQELLDGLSSSILALKLEAQGQATDRPTHDQTQSDRRKELEQFLRGLEERVRAVAFLPIDGGVNLPFAGLADRYIALNPQDVRDRLDELDRLRTRLHRAEPLRPQDFAMLDDLQTLLEEEAAENVRGLFRL